MSSHETIIEALRLEWEADLQAARRKERAADRAAERKARRSGYAGELCEVLTVARRHWPALHEAATSAGVPLRTARLDRADPGHYLEIRTTTAGALRLLSAIKGRP